MHKLTPFSSKVRARGFVDGACGSDHLTADYGGLNMLRYAGDLVTPGLQSRERGG
jgi:hypothetical protein